MTHHQADGPCNPVTVAEQFRLIGHAHVLQIRGGPRDQLQYERLLDAALFHQGQPIADHGICRRTLRDITAGSSEFRESTLPGCGFVRQIIEVTAESVKTGRTRRMFFPKQIPGPVKASSLLDEDGFRGPECNLIFTAAHGTEDTPTGGIMESTTFAVQRTPGRPAPGCVPAPVR